MQISKTNKEQDEAKLKRMHLIQIACFAFFLPIGVVVLIAGGMFNSNAVMAVGMILIVAGISGLLLNDKSKVLKLRIEKYCPNCHNLTLFKTNTTKEKTGIFKEKYVTRGPLRSKRELILETDYYKCKNCGHETHSSITYDFPDW